MGEKFKVDPEFDVGNTETWDKRPAPSVGASPASRAGASGQGAGGQLARSLMTGGAGLIGGLAGGASGFALTGGSPFGVGAGAVAGAGGMSAAAEGMLGGTTQDMAAAGLTGAAGELLGRAAGPLAVKGAQGAISGVGRMLSPEARAFLAKAGSRIYKPYNARLTPGAAEAQALTVAQGGTLSMGQVVDDPMIDTLEGIARASWFSRGMMGSQQRRAVEGNLTGLQGYVDGIIRGVAPTERAALLVDTLKGSDKAFSAAASRMYGEVDALYGTAGVDIAPVLAWAGTQRGNLLKTMGKQADVAVGRLEDFIAPGNPARPIKGLPGQPKAPERILRPGTITFQEAQKLRSSFIRLREVEGDAASPQTQQITAQLVKQLDAAMETAGSKLPGSGGQGSAAEAWRAANEFYKGGADAFNSKFLLKWINSENPSAVYQAMTTAPVENVKRIMSVIDSYESNLGLAGRPTAEMVAARTAAREARDNIQGGVIEKMLHQATEEVGPGLREVSGEKLGALAHKLAGVQDERLKAIFGGDHKGFFDRVKALQFALAGPEKGGMGSLSIQQRSATAGITIATAALGALGGNALGGGMLGAGVGAGLGTAGTIVLGSRALAALFRDKAATEALIHGLKAPIGTKTSARAIAHFVSQLARLELLGEPGTKLPIPAPNTLPAQVEGVQTGEDLLRRTVSEKVNANRDRNIELLWEAAAAGAPE